MNQASITAIREHLKNQRIYEDMARADAGNGSVMLRNVQATTERSYARMIDTLMNDDEFKGELK